MPKHVMRKDLGTSLPKLNRGLTIVDLHDVDFLETYDDRLRHE
jgi:hypothetical protein